MNLRICFQEDRGETFQDATRLFLCGIVFVILSMSVLAAVCQLAEIFLKSLFSICVLIESSNDVSWFSICKIHQSACRGF